MPCDDHQIRAGRFLVQERTTHRVNLSYISPTGAPGDDTGDPHTGWDRFGRTQDLRWSKSSDGTVIDRFKYGYNRGSQRTWCTEPLAPSAHPQDEAYGYDALYQLTGFSRGVLNTNHTAIGGIPAAEENFNYDPIGNWQSYVTKADGVTTLDQTRTSTTTNEILKIDGSGTFVAYDENGNMTLAPPVAGNWNAAYTLVWDAWNRLVEVKDGSTLIAQYAYDGLTRRITRTVGSLVTHQYYNHRWKVIEEREGTSTDAARSYVWGLRYRDDLVTRTAKYTPSGGSPVTETSYALHDYYNVTAIVDTSGAVQERYGYTAFGETRFMAADYTHQTGSDHVWDILYKSQQRDTETGFYNYGYRYFLPPLGRWPSRDPIAEEGGLNLFGFVKNNGVNGTDHLGLHDFVVVGGTRTTAESGHDKNPWQHLTAGMAEAKLTKESYPAGCGCVTYLFVYKSAYDARAKQGAAGQPAGTQTLSPTYWTGTIEPNAKKAGVELVEYTSVADLLAKIKAKAAIDPCKGINHLSYFGHGEPKSLFIGFGFTNIRMTATDLDTLGSLFNKGGEFLNFGCNGGLDLCPTFTKDTGVTSVGADTTVGWGPIGTRESRFPTTTFTGADGVERSGDYLKFTSSGGSVKSTVVTGDYTKFKVPPQK